MLTYSGDNYQGIYGHIFKAPQFALWSQIIYFSLTRKVHCLSPEKTPNSLIPLQLPSVQRPESPYWNWIQVWMKLLSSKSLGTAPWVKFLFIWRPVTADVQWQTRICQNYCSTRGQQEAHGPSQFWNLAQHRLTIPRLALRPGNNSPWFLVPFSGLLSQLWDLLSSFLSFFKDFLYVIEGEST